MAREKKAKAPRVGRKFSLSSLNRPFTVIILLILAVAAVAAAIFYFNSVKKLTVSEAYYRYDAGAKIEQSTLPTVLHHEDGITYQMVEKTKEDLTSSPLYFDGGNKVILPQIMGIVQPESKMVARLPFFAELKKGEGIIITEQEKTKTATEGLLYDGHGAFVFLEPMTLKWGTESLSLSPFSYVRIEQNQFFEAYDSTGEPMDVVLTQETVTAVAASGYTLDLTRMILMRPDQPEEILISSVANLKEFL